jgi:acetolactate synthase-like protein
MFWKPTIAIEGDVASFITEVANGLKGYKCDSEWVQKLKDKDNDKESANRYYSCI